MIKSVRGAGNTSAQASKKTALKSGKDGAAVGKQLTRFTDEERAAMKERAQELKAEARRDTDKAAGESALLAAIAAMPQADRAIAQAAACAHQGQCANPLAQDLVWDARVRQGRQGCLLLPGRVQVQIEVSDVRLQRRGEAR